MLATVRTRIASFLAASGALVALWLGLASGAAATVPETATPAPAASTAPAPSGGDPWAAPAAAKPEAEPAGPAPVSAAPATRARALLGVRAEASGSATLVHLDADGSVEGATSFVLAQPARLVVDLPGVQSKVAQNPTPVAAPHVQRVRVGQHEGKVRVVLDGENDAKALEARQLVPVAGGLVVAVGPSDAVAQAVSALPGTPVQVAAKTTPAEDAVPAKAAPAAPAAKAAPAAPAKDVARASGATVEAVELVKGDVADQVVVSTDRASDYQVMRPDAETLVLAVPGAKLGADARARITPEAGGPVSLVSAFEQPDLGRPEVRVVVKRASGLEPRVSKDGHRIVLAFERTGVAARLPIEKGAGEAPAKTAATEAKPSSAGVAEAPKAAEKAIAAAAASLAPSEPSAAALEGREPIQQLEEGGLLDGKQYVGRRISLDFKDVDIRDVLRLVADVSDLNIIAGDEVTGNVTIRLVDVPWDQALDVILLTKGLGFVRVGNVLRIAPAELLKQEEEARLQERRAKEKLEDLVVKLQPVNYANVKEISKLVKRLLTPRGTVDIDERTNTVIIKDIPSVIDEATALVKAIDSQTPQVMIEARIVEAALDFSKEIGAEWGVGSQPDNDETDFTIGGVKPITTPNSNWPYNQANNVVVTNPITLTPAGLLNLGAFVLDDRIDLDVRIAAAELNGEGKVISAPRVVTLDNREATIEQGVSIPYQTFENGDAQLEFVDAVLSLKVKPHITADQSIIMAVEVTRNAPDDSIDTTTGSPAIQKNQAKTETLVKDGQTLVLGGIYVIETSDKSQRVPGLWKIPILGTAFRNFDVEDSRRELLIFVTPSVVQGAAVAG